MGGMKAGRWIAEVAYEMLQNQDIYEGAKICACVWRLWGAVQMKRKRFTGIQCFLFQVVMLAMYNLSLEGTGRQGYFRWKEDICAFIEKHWTFLLGNR